MTLNAPPSRNPTDNDSLNGTLRLVLTKFLQKIDDMLPAQVIAYDPATNMAQVQPLISVVTTDNQIVQRAQVASIPVLQLSGGGFILNFPIHSGDFGWIKANDRDISLFVQTEEMSPPNTQRKHSFEDAIFIPQAARSLITIAGGDVNNVVLQNYAGTCKISMSETGVTITTPDTVVVNTETVTVNSSTSATVNAPIATINSSTSVTVNTPTATFTGDVTIEGIINVQNTNSATTPCTVNGNISTNGDVIASSISLVHHVHGGVTTGPGDTGAPV